MSTSRRPPPTADTAALLARGLRVSRMLREWPEAVLARIAAGSHLERYGRGGQVNPDAPQRRDLLVVVAGTVEVSGINAAGAKFVLSRLGAGEIVGLVRLLDEVASGYLYHAVEETLLVHIPALHLHEVLDAHPLLWRDVALLALQRQQDSIVTLQRRGFRRIDQSLAQALLRMLQQHAIAMPGQGGITLRVSQGELAAMVSVSRQTINKEMRRLADRGMLAVSYGEVQVRDVAALERLAQGA